MSEPQQRKFVPPLGWPFKVRAVTITPANRPRLVSLNRYTRQVIGVCFRLPDSDDPSTRDPYSGERRGHHRALSIMWAKPARWWR